MQTDIEQADAKRVEEAFEHLQNRNISKAEDILREVCSRCPERYEYEYTSDGTRYIKFWDLKEFLFYTFTDGEQNKENVVWLPSVYPRACYHLAYVLVEKRDFAGAINWLHKGRSMEPRNPKFLLELGVAHAHLQAHQLSYDCYLQAYELASAGHERAVALRGMGVQLIDLQRLDEAEARLKESLTIDADNASAKHELIYIAQLRSSRKELQHYFAYRWLPGLSFYSPAQYMKSLRVEGKEIEGKNFLRRCWQLACGRLQSKDPFPENDLSCEIVERFDGTTIGVVALPRPLVVPEAYFVAAVYHSTSNNGKPLTRFFTLEYGMTLENTPCTVLGELGADGSHMNLGDGPVPTVAAFVEAIAQYIQSNQDTMTA